MNKIISSIEALLNPLQLDAESMIEKNLSCKKKIKKELSCISKK